jgi:hypothetical protein
VPRARGRGIVVDASIAGRAGSIPSSGGSVPCREVLNAMTVASHRIVFSPEALAEWKRHQRSFARRWLTRMVASRQVDFLDDVQDDRFRAKLLPCAPSPAKRRAMEKDAHLLEAALQADRIVISCDEKIRALFRDACGEVREIRQVSWANPEIEVEGVADWVREGARAEAKRRLGTL